MKFAVAFAVLFASVAIFGATASTPIDNELEELELLISIGKVEYSGGLVDTIRDKLQNILNKIKEKLGVGEGLDGIKARIDEVQEKIRDLVKQGGIKLVQKIHEIRDKLHEILKNVIDRISPGKGLYTTDDAEVGFGQRLSEFVQSHLDALRERLADAKGLAQDLKEKFLVQIAELKEEVLKLAHSTGQSAIELYRKLRERVRLVLTELKNHVTGIIGHYKVETFLEKLVANIKNTFENGLEKLKERLAKNQGLFESFKNKIEDLQIKIAEFGQKAGDKLSEVAAGLRQKLKDLAEKISERLSKTNTYALYDDETEEHNILTVVAQRIREFGQKIVEKLAERLEQSKGLLAEFKDRIEEVKAKLVELGKQTGLKALEVAKALQQKIKDLAAQVAERLGGKQTYSVVYEDEEEKEHDTILTALAKRIRDIGQRLLDKFREQLSKSKEIYAIFKDKIDELSEKLKEIGKQSGIKALEIAHKIRDQIKALAGQIADKISGKEQLSALYSAEGDDDEEKEIDPENSSLIQRLIERVRKIAVDTIAVIKTRLEKHKEIAAEFKEKIDEVTQKLADLAKQGGRRALESARALRKKIFELNLAILNKISGKGNLYAIYNDDDDDDNIDDKELDSSLIQRLIQRARKIAQDTVELIKTRLEKHKEIAEEFKDRIAEVTQGLADLAKQGGRKALDNARALRKKVHDLNLAILKKITGKSLYDAEEKEDEDKGPLGGFLNNLANRVRDLTQKAVDKLKAKVDENKEALEQFRETLAAIEDELKETANAVGRKALNAIKKVEKKIKAIKKSIKDKLAEKPAPVGYSMYQEMVDEDAEDKEIEKTIKEGEEEIEKEGEDKKDDEDEEEGPMDGFFGNLAKRITGFLKMSLNDLTKKVENGKEDLAEFKDRVEEAKEELKSLSKTKGKKALDGVNAVQKKVETLKKEIKKKLKDIKKAKKEEETVPALYARDLRADLIQIKAIVTTNEGLQALKNYLSKIDSVHPIVQVVKDFVGRSTDDELLEVLREFFSGLNYSLKNFYAQYASLSELFRNVRDEILTDDGLARLRKYAETLQSNHPVVSRIKAILVTVDDDTIRTFLEELFDGLDSVFAPVKYSLSQEKVEDNVGGEEIEETNDEKASEDEEEERKEKEEERKRDEEERKRDEDNDKQDKESMKEEEEGTRNRDEEAKREDKGDGVEKGKGDEKGDGVEEGKGDEKGDGDEEGKGDEKGDGDDDGEKNNGDDDDDDDDDEKEGAMDEVFSEKAKRITGFVQKSLDDLNIKVENAEEALAEIKDKLEEAEDELEDAEDKEGKKALDSANIIQKKVNALKKEIKKKLKNLK